MTYAGIDKVALHTRAYVVKSLSGWDEKAGRKVGEAPPVFVHDQEGQEVPGTGFYLNAEHFNVDLSPKGLLVSFNPSKIRHPYALLTDPSEVGRIGDDVQRTLQRHGVLVDVNGMQSIRVDLAKQRQLTHPLNAYGQALSNLKGKRMTGHAYPDGYAFRNTQREAVFYNKTRELHEKTGLTIPESRLGRFEVKWKKGRPLAKDFQLSSFGDLRRADPEQLTSVYREALNGQVFRTDPKAVQMILSFDTDLSVYRQLKQEHPRGAIWQYLSLGHVSATVEAHGGIDGIQRFMLAAGDNPRTVRHTLQQLRKRLQRDAFLNARRNKAAVNIHTLIEELRHTYAA